MALRECKKSHEIARKLPSRGRKLQFFDFGKSEQLRAGMRSQLSGSQAKANRIALKDAFAARDQNPENLS